jgi:hypothetical protein
MTLTEIYQQIFQRLRQQFDAGVRIIGWEQLIAAVIGHRGSEAKG